MTDLINRVKNLKQETIDKLNNKYESIIPYLNIRDNNNTPYFLYIINLSVNYIQANYNNEKNDWKALTILLTKKLIEKREIKTKEDLFYYIDEFLKYKKSEYDTYISNAESYPDYFYNYLEFIENFMSSLNL